VYKKYFHYSHGIKIELKEEMPTYRQEHGGLWFLPTNRVNYSHPSPDRKEGRKEELKYGNMMVIHGINVQKTPNAFIDQVA